MAAKNPFALGAAGLVRIATAVVPVLLFSALIAIRIPYHISRALSVYSLPLFVGVLLLYFAGFRLPGKYGWVAVASLTMLLLALALSFLWNSGYSDDKIIAGLLPFRDAFDYFNGADWIFSGQVIRNINEGAAWRPLYPGFLAALLWITGRNLQWALAIQVGVAGLCISLAALQVRRRWGAAAGALFATLLYFYIQPLIGTAYTETLGLALGCLGFVLLCVASEARSAPGLAAGLVVLMLAVSVRAGAFFIFPALIVWAGWAWRAGQRFSVRYAGMALVAAVLTYAVVNTAFSKLMVEPGGFPFGNFAFTFYGQVNGGAGYHKAFEDLGVRNPAVILHAAERFFMAHPASFLVGAAKAYRDFFSPRSGVFSFGLGAWDLGLSVVLTLLLLFGLYRCVRESTTQDASLLLAAFVGILLSVPFLPPIDGGIRIYASTMPFVYAIPALAVAALWRARNVEPIEGSRAVSAAAVATLLATLTVLVPVAIRYLTPGPEAAAFSCPAGQMPYVATISAGSYIDLLPQGTADCGTLPEVCLGGFRSYTAANDPSDAAVFAQLAAAAETSPVRIFDANNLVDGRPHVFLGPALDFEVHGRTWISGCAAETQVKGRPSIYSIQSLTLVGQTQ